MNRDWGAQLTGSLLPRERAVGLELEAGLLLSPTPLTTAPLIVVMGDGVRVLGPAKSWLEPSVAGVVPGGSSGFGEPAIPPIAGGGGERAEPRGSVGEFAPGWLELLGWGVSSRGT